MLTQFGQGAADEPFLCLRSCAISSPVLVRLRWCSILKRPSDDNIKVTITGGVMSSWQSYNFGISLLLWVFASESVFVSILPCLLNSLNVCRASVEMLPGPMGTQHLQQEMLSKAQGLCSHHQLSPCPYLCFSPNSWSHQTHGTRFPFPCTVTV